MRKRLKFIAIALVFYALVFAVPDVWGAVGTMSAKAESRREIIQEKTKNQETNKSQTKSALRKKDDPYINSKQPGEAYILSERIDRRGRFSKQYGMSDGTILVEQFSYPVHFFDESTNQYLEINNTLEEVTLENGTKEYVNSANEFKAVFNKAKTRVEYNGSVIQFWAQFKEANIANPETSSGIKFKDIALHASDDCLSACCGETGRLTAPKKNKPFFRQA